MNMRRNIPQIFVILLLSILVLCSGCVLPGNQNTTQNAGLVQVTVQTESSRISFDTARERLKEYQTDSLNGTISAKKIYYIFAKDIDDSGNAMSWVFGVNYGMGDRLLIYDRNGWTSFPKSNTTLPSEEIVVDKIVSPSDLFTKNKAVILSATSPSAIPEVRDLELQAGIYRLTLSSGGKGRIFTFNSTTGVLIT
jgi:hypothetical protein